MGVPSLEMTFLMVFPLLWTICCFSLARRNSVPPWPEKNFSHLALHSLREQADSHSGQTCSLPNKVAALPQKETSDKVWVNASRQNREDFAPLLCFCPSSAPPFSRQSLARQARTRIDISATHHAQVLDNRPKRHSR